MSSADDARRPRTVTAAAAPASAAAATTTARSALERRLVVCTYTTVGPTCKGAGVKIFTGGGTSVCIVDLSLDDPVESDAATGSVPRELLVLLLPGLLAIGLL